MGIINEIKIAAPVVEVNTAELESRLQILTNEVHTNYINTDGSIGMQSNLNMDENKIINISTEYPPSDQAQALSWSQVLTFVRIATRELFEKAGGKITGDVNMDGNKILNLSTDYPPSDQAQALSWSQIAQFLRRSTTNLANKTGETFSGDINMDNNKIINIADPVDDGDVVNKRTVDLKLNIGMFLGARVLIGFLLLMI